MSLHYGPELLAFGGVTFPALLEFLSQMQVDGSEDFLSEEEIVQIAIGFANNDADQARLSALWVGLSKPPAKFRLTNLITRTDGSMAQSDLEVFDQLEPELRPTFTAELAKLVTKPESTTDFVEQVAAKLSNKVATMPHYKITNRRMEIQHRVMPLDIPTGLYFAMSLVLDRQRPFYGNLCRCQLDDCKRIFLAISPSKGKGRTRRWYCSQEHMQTVNDRKNSERVAQRRARQRDHLLRVKSIPKTQAISQSIRRPK